MNEFEKNFKASILYLSHLLEEQGKYDDAKMLMFVAAIDFSRPLEEIKEILKRYMITLEKKKTKHT